MCRIELSGNRFGKLVVLKYSHSKPRKNGGGITFWKCICDCGKFHTCRGQDLKSGKTKACGCLKGSVLKHGLSGTKLYSVWKTMIQRCENKSTEHFKYYGGRGIKVCREWHNSSVFFKWALSSGYRVGITLDRFPNNDGNYEPGNCRWATMKEQSNNRRQRKQAIL